MPYLVYARSHDLSITASIWMEMLITSQKNVPRSLFLSWKATGMLDELKARYPYRNVYTPKTRKVWPPGMS
jgi:hypothetical protein